MRSYSQGGQDLFVHALIPRNDGTFIDIGCGEGPDLSNTFGLEELGWRGTCVDVIPPVGRLSTVIAGDATKMIWHTSGRVDYLSLDIDNHSVFALQRLPLHRLSFNVITIEHDAYRFGDVLRVPERQILSDAGYVLLCKDVSNMGQPWEDWWVHPDIKESAARFQSDRMDWRQILKQGGVEL